MEIYPNDFLCCMLRAELSLCKQLLFEGMGAGAARQVFDAEKVNLEQFSALGPSLLKNEKLVVRIGDRYFPWNAAAPIILGMVCFGQEIILEPQGMIPVDGDEGKNGASRSITPSRGSWLWPFLKRSKTISNANATSKGNEIDVDLASQRTGNMTQQSDMLQAKNSKKVQSLTPTSDEIASLNLKEGQNVVTFSFSTPVLGSQQVLPVFVSSFIMYFVANYLLCSILHRSDVLGQFMPLVGIDWSQTGVAHLFSAIKV
ncbi:hypothetical protein B296_00034547 [Ensete ventricosum]|uniref:Lipin middle domain-containing protein n=1 Tax=Ensete ventricosum TaxID=4639 RepID=A0A427A5U3_ENSVE|nr:hypothetical protein B296_00034547 [Ensete ventricosum]